MMPKLLYITCKDTEEATKIARALVEEKLVACANILPGIKSFFHWEGKLEEADEVVIIAKTMEKQLDKVIARVKALHSYDCPCIVALPLTGGNPDFLRWVEESL